MVSKLDLCLEIDPSKFLLVIGPDFTTSVINELSEAHQLSIRSNHPDFQGDGRTGKSPRTPSFALKHIVDEGIRVLLDAEEYSNDTERAKCEHLYRNAYELDPQFALKKVAMSLQQAGKYAEWLRRAFEVELESHILALAPHSVSLGRIIELQSKGALLIYVHCDDILSRVSRTTPVLLEDSDGLEQWLKGEKAGFLHVHGVYWEPDTVKIDGQFYESPSHVRPPTAERLKLLFQERHSVVIGCESHPTDPLVSQFIKEFMCEEQRHQNKQHTFHLPLTRSSSKLDSGLPLISSIPLSSSSTSLEQDSSEKSSHRPVHSVLCPMAESSISLWRQIEFPSYELKDNQMLGLLVPGKQGAIEISRMMYNTPGVNFALVSSAMYKGHFLSVVCIRVDSSKIRDLWVWLFEEEKEMLLGKGLLAIVMQSGTFVWLRGKPSSGTKVPAVGEFSKVLSEAPQLAEDTTGGEAMDTDTTTVTPPVPIVIPTIHHTPSPSSSSSSSLTPNLSAPPHLFRPHPKSQRSKSSTLVPQIKEEFSSTSPSPPPSAASVKAMNKKVPRYTVTKFRVKQGSNVMINGIPCPPSILKPSAKHPHLSIDDSSLLAPPGFSKNMYNRRCSLPHNMKPAVAFTDDQKAEATLHQLAEHMHSTPPHLEPPSYAAIKQALLCDQYKRRQSMQTDPKTLKNLLQTKLVISDNRNEIVSLRRKSDPGSYLKQRDFERRKELFIDENQSWSQAYGKVIDRKIAKWERKRVERMHREMLMRQFGAAGGDHGQLKFQFFNPLAAQQGLINPLSAAANGIQPGAAATSTLLAPSFLGQNPAAAGIGANPFIFSQPVIAPTPASTTAAGATTMTPGSSSMFYSPFLTPYTFVNPYTPTLQVTNALGQPTAATYFIPQQQTSPQKVLYFVPSTNGAATVSPAPAGVPVSVTNLNPPTQSSTTSMLASTLSSTNSPSSQTSSLTGSPSPSIITQPPPPPHHIISTTSSTSPENSLSSSSNAPPPPNSAQQQAPGGGNVSLANFPQLSSLMAPVSRTGHRNSLHSISSSSSSLSKDMSDETESYEYRPVSPGSRKRHQSVPEKLTSLLQHHSPLRGHVSPVSHDEYEEDEPVTPPSVKKQRSTSDTTVLYPPYSSRFSQLSPPNTSSGGLGGHLSKSKSTSPQPQEQRGSSLTAFQSHLLKVHQVQHNNSSSGNSGGIVSERHRRIGVHSPNAMSHSPGGGGSTTSHYSNYIIRENSPEEIDEREIEDIVGGAIRSSGQQQDHQGPAPHSQLQLWQFLLELLLISANTHLIQWTEGEFEFQIKSPTEVAQLWGQVTNNPSMNYEKLAIGLRYYYTKGIMSKVPGKRLTFRYAGSIRNYVQMRRSQMVSSHEEIVVVE